MKPQLYPQTASPKSVFDIMINIFSIKNVLLYLISIWSYGPVSIYLLRYFLIFWSRDFCLDTEQGDIAVWKEEWFVSQMPWEVFFSNSQEYPTVETLVSIFGPVVSPKFQLWRLYILTATHINNYCSFQFSIVGL